MQMRRKAETILSKMFYIVPQAYVGLIGKDWIIIMLNTILEKIGLRKPQNTTCIKPVVLRCNSKPLYYAETEGRKAFDEGITDNPFKGTQDETSWQDGYDTRGKEYDAEDGF